MSTRVFSIEVKEAVDILLDPPLQACIDRLAHHIAPLARQKAQVGVACRDGLAKAEVGIADRMCGRSRLKASGFEIGGALDASRQYGVFLKEGQRFEVRASRTTIGAERQTDGRSAEKPAANQGLRVNGDQAIAIEGAHVAGLVTKSVFERTAPAVKMKAGRSWLLFDEVIPGVGVADVLQAVCGHGFGELDIEKVANLRDARVPKKKHICQGQCSCECGGRKESQQGAV